MPPRDPDRPKGLGVLGLLAQHPALTRAYHTLTGHVLFATTLTPRWRELLVLRVAAVRGAAYEWAQHVVIAADAGISAEEVRRVAEGPGAEGWSPLEAAMLAAVDELLAAGDIGDDTYTALAAELDHRQILDLVATVGTYDLLAMLLQTARIDLDDDLRAAGGNDLLILRDS